jgi:two-component system chemotaxis response regulator CheY
MFDANTRILIVDDMMTMRKLVGKICKELGFTNLAEASDGIQAWEQIQSANPPIGLIISDWNMPNCSGIDLVKRLRSDSRFGKTPFLMVTAESEQAQVVEALKAGVDNYVVKPFSAATLTEKLTAIHKKIAKQAG